MLAKRMSTILNMFKNVRGLANKLVSWTTSNTHVKVPHTLHQHVGTTINVSASYLYKRIQFSSINYFEFFQSNECFTFCNFFLSKCFSRKECEHNTKEINSWKSQYFVQIVTVWTEIRVPFQIALSPQICMIISHTPVARGRFLPHSAPIAQSTPSRIWKDDSDGQHLKVYSIPNAIFLKCSTWFIAFINQLTEWQPRGTGGVHVDLFDTGTGGLPRQKVNPISQRYIIIEWSFK